MSKRLEGEIDWNKLPPPYSPRKFQHSKRMLFAVYGLSAFYSFWFLYNFKKHYYDKEHPKVIETLPEGLLYRFNKKKSAE